MTKIIKKAYFSLMVFLLPLLTRAQEEETGPEEITLDPFTATSIPGLIGNIIRVVLGFTGVVALLMIIYGGILWLTSGGNQERVKKGRDTLIWAVLGVALIFAAYAIVTTVLGAVAGGGEANGG
jgi:type IV secretory pathway VirB2 component (pilin)